MNKNLKFSNFTALLLLMNVLAPTFANAAALKPVSFSFGLWGDMPYEKNGDGARNGTGSEKMTRLVKSMNASNISFSVYDGDIKDGSSTCTDAALGQESSDFFNSLNKPVVYVPGDNEWTDCHRKNNGSYNGLERLDYLRSTLFNTNKSFGKSKMALTRQGLPGAVYSENSRWTKGNVVFLGLNVPGSNNNKVIPAECISAKSSRVQADCDADNAEYIARDAANIKFMQESFKFAKDNAAAGVMIIIQADPIFDLPETETFNERTSVSTDGSAPVLPSHDGYDAFIAALTTETKNFSGQVVLVHGDTHFYKIDKPIKTDENPFLSLKNFTRVETFGSPNLNWINVKVTPTNPNVFSFEPVFVEGN